MIVKGRLKYRKNAEHLVNNGSLPESEVDPFATDSFTQWDKSASQSHALLHSSLLIALFHVVKVDTKTLHPYETGHQNYKA